jgi:hypothetical protein
VTSASSLRTKAAEIRKIAAGAINEAARWQLSGIADRFDRLASHIEALSHFRTRRADPPSPPLG